MAKRFEFPASRALTFPEQCICCGQPKEATVTSQVSRLVMDKHRQVSRTVTLEVPLCARCQRTDQRLLLLSLLTFALGFVIIGGACFVFLYLMDAGVNLSGLLDIDDVPGRPDMWLAIAGGLSILAGFAGGFLIERAARLPFLPFVGQALYFAPSLAVQIFGDVAYVAGMRASLSQNASQLRLTLFNDAVADEFDRLNR